MKYPKRHKNIATGRKEQASMAGLMDALSQFEEWRREILPALAKDVKAGLSSEALRKKYAAMLTAKLISFGLMSDNPASAVPAIKDVLDRHEGRPTEKIEVTEKHKNLPDEQLDAIVESEIKDLKEMLN